MLRGMNPILMMMMAMLLMLTLMLASMEKPQKQMRAKPRVTWERSGKHGDLEKEGWQERMKTTMMMIVAVRMRRMPVTRMPVMMILVKRRRRMPLTRMPVMSPMERISPHSHSGPNWPRTT